MSTYQASNSLPFLQYMVMARLITKGEGLQKKKFRWSINNLNGLKARVIARTTITIVRYHFPIQKI